MKRDLSRRSFLTAMGLGAGALVGSRLGGREWVGTAQAAVPEPTTVVLVYLAGGLNGIFTGADAFFGNNTFQASAGNSTAMGPVFVDNTLASAIPEQLRNKVASIGIRHGISDHGVAERANFAVNGGSAPLVLASAMGGSGSIKAAVVGSDSLPNGDRPAAVGGVSLEAVRDMAAAADAVVGTQAGPNVVDRAGAAKGMVTAQNMSRAVAAKHGKSLASMTEGLVASTATLVKPVQVFDRDEFARAYSLRSGSVDAFNERMAATELMVRFGANVVLATDNDWDTHGDRTGTRARNQMRERIAPGLNTFLTRMVQNASAERNVVVAIFGDFGRSLPDSDHQPNGSALIIGKTLKNETTGKTDRNAGLPAGTASIPGFWSLLAAAAKLDNNPFGANPHGKVLA